MKLVLVLSLLFLIGCKPDPEFYINGKPYYTCSRCVKSHTIRECGYHYGYNPFRGKFEYHFGNYSKTICDESKVDTIEIK